MTVYPRSPGRDCAYSKAAITSQLDCHLDASPARTCLTLIALRNVNPSPRQGISHCPNPSVTAQCFRVPLDMDSLLLRALPSIRLPFTTSPLKSSPKLAPGKDATTGTLLRALKSANNLLLSLRDGLIDGERECERRIEERRQILSLRMKNVCRLRFPAVNLG